MHRFLLTLPSSSPVRIGKCTSRIWFAPWCTFPTGFFIFYTKSASCLLSTFHTITYTPYAPHPPFITSLLCRHPCTYIECVFWVVFHAAINTVSEICVSASVDRKIITSIHCKVRLNTDSDQIYYLQLHRRLVRQVSSKPISRHDSCSRRHRIRNATRLLRNAARLREVCDHCLPSPAALDADYFKTT